MSKSYHKGKLPVILKQFILFWRNNVNIKDERWWQVIYTATFMVSYILSVYFQEKIWLSALVHLKFKNDRKSCHFKEILQSRDVLRAQCIPYQKGNLTYYCLCISSVFKYITDFCSHSQNSALLILSGFPVVQTSQSTGGHRVTCDSPGIINQVPSLGVWGRMARQHQGGERCYWFLLVFTTSGFSQL